MKALTYTRGQALPEILNQRIAILDGAMGTMIQRFKLGEADYRGERFKDIAQDVKGNNELLSLTRPDVISDIHQAYLAAGADMIETNTFGATSIAQADYDMADLAVEMNHASAALARAACDKYSTPDKPRFAVGALGPTPKTASISPEVNDPGARNVDFESLRAAYYAQTQALVEGGVDALLVETVFDTLNAKAALFAIDHQWHRDRRFGPHFERPNRHGFLAQRAPRTALGNRFELRLGRHVDAALHSRAGQSCKRHLHQLLPQRRLAQPHERDRF